MIALVCLCILLPGSVMGQSDEAWIPVAKKGQHGFINEKGKLHLPLMPFQMAPIGGDFIVCSTGDHYPNYRFNPDRITPVFGEGESGLMNKKGEWILPLSDQKIGYWGNGLFWTCKGAKIRKYCTEPHHVEGGQYGFANANGMVIDSLDDIAVGFVNGVAPVLRDGKVALIDTTGKLITGFIYDKVVWQDRYFDDERKGIADVRLWKLAIRGEGKWYSVLEQGELLLLDWPADLKVKLRTPGWRKAYSDWISTSRTAHLPCPTDLRIQDRPVYISQDLSYRECFPAEEYLAGECQKIQAQSLRKLKLKVLKKDSLNALADHRGRLLTDWSEDTYNIRSDGLVTVHHIEELLLDSTDLKESEYEDEFGDEFGDAFGDESTSENDSDWDDWDEPPSMLFGLLSPSGKLILHPHFEEVDVYPDLNLIMASTFRGDSLFDMEGNLIDSGSGYVEIDRVRKDLFVYRSDSGNVIMDKNHCVLVRDERYIDNCFLERNWLWYSAGHNKNFYGLQMDGDSLIGPIRTYLKPRETYAYMQRHQQFNCDTCGVQILDTGQWKIFRGQKEGVANEKGRMIIPLDDWAVYENTGGYKLVKDDLLGFADLKGRIILPIRYTKIWVLGKYFKVFREQDGREEVAIFNRQGKVLWDFAEE